MNARISIRLIVATAAVVCLCTVADQTHAQTGGRQTARQVSGQQGGGQTPGTATGAQAIGSSAPSGAVTGQIGRSGDRMLQDVGAGNRTGGTGGIGGLGGLGGGRGIGGFGGMGGFNPFGANPFGANTASSKPAVRTRLINGVQPIATGTPGGPSSAATLPAPRTIVSSPVSKIVNGYAIEVSDGVATLSGVAKSDRDRRMAELLVKLEPGVNQIENQIVVAP